MSDAPWRDPSLFVDGRMPHCDWDVLHAPGSCEICDEYAPKAQDYRREHGINFTGPGYDPALKPCPARARRWDGCQAWAGNTPYETATCQDCGKSYKKGTYCLFCELKSFPSD